MRYYNEYRYYRRTGLIGKIQTKECFDESSGFERLKEALLLIEREGRSSGCARERGDR